MYKAKEKYKNILKAFNLLCMRDIYISPMSWKSLTMTNNIIIEIYFMDNKLKIPSLV